MVGMTRAEVLACAGAPLREARDGNLRIMSYGDTRFIDGDSYRCEVSVALRDDKVDSVRARGARRVCVAILRGCAPS